MALIDNTCSIRHLYTLSPLVTILVFICLIAISGIFQDDLALCNSLLKLHLFLPSLHSEVDGAKGGDDDHSKCEADPEENLSDVVFFLLRLAESGQCTSHLKNKRWLQVVCTCILLNFKSWINWFKPVIDNYGLVKR